MVNKEQKYQQIFTHHALRLYALRFTHYAQPIFGANAPPTTTQFHALRITLYALRFTHHALRPHFPNSPILPSNPLNHASRITLQMAIK